MVYQVKRLTPIIEHDRLEHLVLPHDKRRQFLE
jgi:hypothetical protein